MSDLTNILVGILAVVVPSLVAIWVFRRSRKKREISCDFVTLDYSLTPYPDGPVDPGHLVILYKDDPIENLFFLTAEFSVTGNQPISSGLLSNPITISFPEDVKLVEWPKLRISHPEDLNVLISDSPAQSKKTKRGIEIVDRIPNTVYLKFDFLNPDDNFSIAFLCSGNVTTPKVLARIEGGKLLTSYKAAARISGGALKILPQAEINPRTLREEYKTLGPLFIVMGIGYSVFLFWLFYAFNSEELSVVVLVSLTFILLAIVLIPVFFFRMNERSRKKSG